MERYPQEDHVTDLPHLATHTTLLALVPTMAGFTASVVAARSTTPSVAWRAARAATWVTLAAAAAVAFVSATSDVRAGTFVRVDPVTAVVLALVAVVGWVVVRFASRYLAGDRRERRAAAFFAATLASVGAVVVANDLILVAVAWFATSLALHGLLTHAADRPVAQAVAHKKFVLARAADGCVLGAVILLFGAFGTTRLDAMATQVTTDGTLPAGAHLGVFLVAMAAVLKCAQLPFHGWLIQVMEAPTPVSALLHAGVVNLGGVVLLGMAVLVDEAVAAQTLLVVVGGITAVVAAVVLTTRVSVKVALAWSTCAQMGIMLVECGLGLWELALLHLVGHSLYKAHAFLRSGSTVRRTLRHRLVPHAARPSRSEVARGLALSAVVTTIVALAWKALPWSASLTAAAWVFVGATAVATTSLAIGFLRRPSLGLFAGIVGLPAVALALHDGAQQVAPHGHTAPAALVVLTVLLLGGLFVAQSALTVAPFSPAVARFRPWLTRGLFIDETFTRALFTLWPPRAPARRQGVLPEVAAVATFPSLDRVTTG